MKFGDKLKELRNGKEMTQPDLAEAIGIEQSYLSKLENNKSLPSNDIFVRMLEVFDLDIGDVVDELDQSSKNQLRALPEIAGPLSSSKTADYRQPGNAGCWVQQYCWRWVLPLFTQATYICFSPMSFINICHTVSCSKENRRRYSETPTDPSLSRSTRRHGLNS